MQYKECIMSDIRINRRTMLKTTGTGLSLAALSGCVSGKQHAPSISTCPGMSLNFKNEYFYKDGKFDVEAGKTAYIALMKYHGVPVFEGIREKLWVSDYGIGEFASLGLGANMYLNIDAPNKAERYMLMDLYLLPNQMLPEHYHLETKNALPKRESWLVRNGLSYIIGEGDETPGTREMMPESQRASATVFHAQKTGPGETVTLNRPTARHSQIAGPEGAIMTEVANYHDNEGVRHSNPKLVFP